MITLELTEEQLGTLIDALGTWMELPSEWEGEEWLRRQDAGADLDMEMREALNRPEPTVETPVYDPSIFDSPIDWERS
jgi:hypothetical protein